MRVCVCVCVCVSSDSLILRYKTLYTLKYSSGLKAFPVPRDQNGVIVLSSVSAQPLFRAMSRPVLCQCCLSAPRETTSCNCGLLLTFNHHLSTKCMQWRACMSISMYVRQFGQAT